MIPSRYHVGITVHHILLKYADACLIIDVMHYRWTEQQPQRSVGHLPEAYCCVVDHPSNGNVLEVPSNTATVNSIMSEHSYQTHCDLEVVVCCTSQVGLNNILNRQRAPSITSVHGNSSDAQVTALVLKLAVF